MEKSRCFLLSRKWLYISVLSLLPYFLCIISCAPNRIYSVNINYDAEKSAVSAYLKADEKMTAAAIAVAEFVDVRQVDDQLVIGQVVEKDGMKILVLPKYAKPTKAVTSGIKNYLVKAGYKITGNIGQWDLKEETMPKADGRIIIGGNIEELEVTCRKGFLTDSYKSRIKLALVLADPAKGKIIYRGSVESSSSLEHVSFSEERMEAQINAALADAIEKIFENRNIAQKIKELTGP